MQPPESFTDDSSSPTSRRQLQGPRPPQLKVRKESHTIRKPPIAPQPFHPPHPPSQAADALIQNRQPVIIYSVSPKVIHTTVSGFMSLVQRLTGSSSTSGECTASASTAGDVSPAARLASTEWTSPTERERDREMVSELMGLVEGIEVGQIPGILSPAPATLPPLSAGIFSPASDPHALSRLQDLSPFFYGNMFLPSPSTLFSAPLVFSPSPSSFGLVNPFLDF